MANQQHIDWLLEGAEAWNARREHEDFKPDFRDADIRGAFEVAKKLDENGRFSLEAAVLKGAILSGAILERADLSGAILSGADLGEAILSGADLRGADLRGEDLSGANLSAADLRGADLGEAILSGADLNGANLNGANLNGANVKTNVNSGAGTNNVSAPEFTDLSNTIFLTQDQLNSMRGDSGTILPDGLIRPADWPEVELPEGSQNTIKTSDSPVSAETPTSGESAGSKTTINREKTAACLRENRLPITMSGMALIEFIEGYKEEVRGDNALGAKYPEFRDKLLKRLDDLIEAVNGILGAVPAPGTELSDDKIDSAQKWTDRFVNSAVPAWQEHLDPKKLGNASAPIGIILTCGTFGYLVSGFNPIGFGAGSLFGKWVTGELKSGVAADKLAEQLNETDDNKE